LLEREKVRVDETKNLRDSGRKENCKRTEEAHLGQAVWILTSQMKSQQMRSARKNTIRRALADVYAAGARVEERARAAMALDAEQPPVGGKTRQQAPVQLPRASLVTRIPVAFDTLAGNNQ
jgi:hypothetical protein